MNPPNPPLRVVAVIDLENVNGSISQMSNGAVFKLNWTRLMNIILEFIADQFGEAQWAEGGRFIYTPRGLAPTFQTYLERGPGFRVIKVIPDGEGDKDLVDRAINLALAGYLVEDNGLPDIIVLGSGDGDHIEAVDGLVHKDIKVVMVAAASTLSSDYLNREGVTVFELDDPGIKPLIKMDQSQGPLERRVELSLSLTVPLGLSLKVLRMFIGLMGTLDELNGVRIIDYSLNDNPMNQN